MWPYSSALWLKLSKAQFVRMGQFPMMDDNYKSHERSFRLNQDWKPSIPLPVSISTITITIINHHPSPSSIIIHHHYQSSSITISHHYWRELVSAVPAPLSRLLSTRRHGKQREVRDTERSDSHWEVQHGTHCVGGAGDEWTARVLSAYSSR